jgi:hypothetical protein
MGNFASGFFGAVGQKLQDVAEKHKADDDKLRDIKVQALHDAINSGNLSPEQMTQTLEELQKLYPKSKGIKGAFEKFGHIADMFHKSPHGQQGQGGGQDGSQGQPQSSAPAQPPAMSEQIPGANASSTGPNAPSMPPRSPQAASATAPQSGGAAPKSAPAPPPTMASILSAAHPSPQAQDDREFAKFKREEELKHKFKMEEAEAVAKAKAANPSGRPVMGPAISVSNARDLAKQGKSFIDKDGQPIDLTTLPDTMGLKNIVWGGKSFYEPFSPNSKVVTVGNETFAVSPMDVEALGQGAGTDLGEHRVGTAHTSVRGLDEKTGVDVTKGTSAPATTGVKGRGSKSAPSAPPQGPTAKPGGAAAPSASGGSRGGAATPSSSGMLPSNATSQRIAPVREAYTQLFGDPTQPSATSLSDFDKLADDPKASKKVASAVRLVLDGMEQEEKRSGSLFTLLKNYGGVPQALIASQLSINKDIIGKLSPEETRAFNSVVSSLSTVMGLRSLTKASAAKFSVAALERDVPVPGLNAMSAAAFNDKMARLAEEVYTGSRTVPLPQEERKYIEALPGKFRDKAQPKSKSKSAPNTPPKLGEGGHPLDDEIKKAVREAQRPAA